MIKLSAYYDEGNRQKVIKIESENSSELSNFLGELKDVQRSYLDRKPNYAVIPGTYIQNLYDLWDNRGFDFSKFNSDGGNIRSDIQKLFPLFADYCSYFRDPSIKNEIVRYQMNYISDLHRKLQQATQEIQLLRAQVSQIQGQQQQQQGFWNK